MNQKDGLYASIGMGRGRVSQRMRCAAAAGTACRPCRGARSEGQVENQVGNVREWLFAPTPKFADLDALNAWLAVRCRELAGRAHPGMKHLTIAEVFAAEQVHLRPICARFDGYFEQAARVSSTCLVSYDRNRYSVPADHAGQRISLRAYADCVVVVAANKEVARHARSFARDTLVLDPFRFKQRKKALL
ncbi:MAG: hypothetical protein PHH47_11165 [Gallionella sp.]|nr:hypothetical protein [Gallionella sp.]MDD4947000.1 hypothetical protein [Gallionella sp.]